MPKSPPDLDRFSAVAQVEQVASLPIQQFAFNSVASATSATDIMSVISIADRPLALLIMSPGTAKTLAESLMDRVREYEEMTGSPVLSAYQISAQTPEL